MQMELDLIIPDVEPNNNSMNEDTKPNLADLLTPNLLHSNSGDGSTLTAGNPVAMTTTAAPPTFSCRANVVPSVMIRPVMTLAPSQTTVLLPQFVPIRPRQSGLQLPVQVPSSLQVQPIPTTCTKTLTFLPKTQVVQPTSSGLPTPLVSVQVGSQRTPPVPRSGIQPAAAGVAPSAVTVVKLPPGTDIEALANTGGSSAGLAPDSRGKAGQFWQYVCGDCPYTTGDYKQYKRHRTMAHEVGKTQTKVCHICNKGFLDLDNHLKVHENGRKHVCDVCDLGFHSPIELENHVAKKHQGRQFLKCGYCDASIAKEDISLHLTTCERFRRQQQQTAK